jgi:hypothetical protein
MSIPGNPFEPPAVPVDHTRRTGRLTKFMLAILASALGTGAVVVLMFGLAMLPEYIESGKTRGSEPEEIVDPPGLTITQHARIGDVDRFSVQGVVENQGDVEWTLVRLQLKVKVGGITFSTCGDGIFGRVPPKSRQPFRITCEETSGSGLPVNTTYEVSVKSATKRTE